MLIIMCVYVYGVCVSVCVCVFMGGGGVLCLLSPLDVDDHLFVNVGIADHGTELLERDSAVLVLVGEHNRLVDYLLQLGVFQVVADHHF